MLGTSLNLLAFSIAASPELTADVLAVRVVRLEEDRVHRWRVQHGGHRRTAR